MNADPAQISDPPSRCSRTVRTPGRKAASARRVMRELGLADERELERTVRANLAFSWRYYGRLLLLTVGPLRRRLRATVNVDGLDNLREALCDGRGAVVVSAHIGDFEIMGAWLAQTFGARLVVPVSEVRPTLRQWFFDHVRRDCGLTLVRETDLQLRDVVRELRQGSLVVLMLDRRPGGPGLTLDLMDKPAAVSRAACVFARRADVAVVPIAGELRPDGRRVLHIGTPARPGDAARGRPAEVLMQTVCSPLEDLIRARPEQWHLPADALQLPWRFQGSNHRSPCPESRFAITDTQPHEPGQAA